jgi:hypothetical protein
VFKGSAAGTQAASDASVAKFFTKLERSPTVKAELYKYLPEDSRQAVDNLGKVAIALNKALQKQIKTGAILAFNADQSGAVAQIAKKLVAPAAAVATSTATRGTGLSGVAGQGAHHVANFIMQKGDRAVAARDMLASKKFKDDIAQAVAEGVTTGNKISKKLEQAEREFTKSKKYIKWASTLEKSQLELITRVGFYNYLLHPSPEDIEPESKQQWQQQKNQLLNGLGKSEGSEEEILGILMQGGMDSKSADKLIKRGNRSEIEKRLHQAKRRTLR